MRRFFFMSNNEKNDLTHWAGELGAALQQVGATLVTAESCTGGWIAQAMTAVPGSSAWFERGFVTYSDTSKQEMLGVSPSTLDAFGAVSEETVREMALGALRRSHAQVSVAVSGIAGPGGGAELKPVGTVCLAWAGLGRKTRSHTAHFAGDRTAVRRQAVVAALQGLLEFLK